MSPASLYWIDTSAGVARDLARMDPGYAKDSYVDPLRDAADKALAAATTDLDRARAHAQLAAAEAAQAAVDAVRGETGG